PAPAATASPLPRCHSPNRPHSGAVPAPTPPLFGKGGDRFGHSDFGPRIDPLPFRKAVASGNRHFGEAGANMNGWRRFGASRPRPNEETNDETTNKRTKRQPSSPPGTPHHQGQGRGGNLGAHRKDGEVLPGLLLPAVPDERRQHRQLGEL